MIIFSKCRSDEVNLVQRQESLLAELKGDVLVTEHIYDLTDDSETLRQLRETAGDWIVLARLYPRAIKCVLDQWGLLDGRQVECVDWREDLPPTVTGREGSPNLTHIEEQVEPRWYPVIDRDRCTGCCECMNFCLFGVYSLEGAGDVTVELPNMCRPGCPACARVCPSKAIIFPECDDPTIAGK
jgi:hypothetical protein